MRDQRPSDTAVKVALSLVYLGQNARIAHLFPPDILDANKRLLRAAGLLKTYQLALYRSRLFRRLGAVVEKRTSPGISLHLGLRKRFIDEETRLALGEGVGQVLVIGAGFDTLAFRLAQEFPEVAFIEVDHPATQKCKARALHRIGATSPNLHLLPADLAVTSLADVLKELDFWQTGVRSVVVAEGLLMYLAPRDVEALFGAVRQSTAAESRFLFSYLVHNEGGRFHLSRVALMYLRLIGEPMRWGVRERDLAAFVERQGFRLASPRERYDLKRRYLEPAGLEGRSFGKIERVALAEVPHAVLRHPG